MGQKEIHKPPSSATGSLDQCQIFSAKSHCTKCPQIIGEFFDRFIVKGELPLACRPVHFYLMRSGPHDVSARKPAFLVVAYHGRTANSPE